jgi:hypothetical protein
MSGFTSFSDFRSKSSTFEALQDQVAALAKGGFKKEDDKTKWKATSDKAGNGSAIIRFLPAPKGEDLPVVKIMTHNFQGPSGKWYIENCPTTINLPCPVCEANSELWNIKGDEDTVKANRKIASIRKRKTTFTANILVVKDPKNKAAEDVEGKVFRFDFGSKIMEKIVTAQSPSEDMKELGAVPIKVLDPKGLWEGANFILSFKEVNEQRTYDASSFGPVCPAADTDEKLEEIWLSEHPLAEIAAEDKFKSHEELLKKLNFVLNAPKSAAKEPAKNVPAEKEPENTEVAAEPQVKAKKAKAEPKEAEKFEKEETGPEEVTDDIEFYRGLQAKK